MRPRRPRCHLGDILPVNVTLCHLAASLVHVPPSTPKANASAGVEGPPSHPLTPWLHPPPTMPPHCHPSLLFYITVLANLPTLPARRSSWYFPMQGNIAAYSSARSQVAKKLHINVASNGRSSLAKTLTCRLLPSSRGRRQEDRTYVRSTRSYHGSTHGSTQLAPTYMYPHGRSIRSTRSAFECFLFLIT